MSDRNWDAELAKIDKQLSSIPDDQLVAEQRKAAAVPASGAGRVGAPTAPTARAALPGAKTAPVLGKSDAGAWASWLKVTLAVAAAVGMMYWPWPGQCGLPLLGFTAATGAVTLLGIWSALGTWRHRLGLAHAASLLVVIWGLVLGAREILPRVGYAMPTLERGAGWRCDAASAPAPATPAASPVITPGA